MPTMSTAETMTRLNWFLVIYDHREDLLVSVVEYGCTSCEEALQAMADASHTKAEHIELNVFGARSLESLMRGYPRYFWNQPPLTPVPHTWADMAPNLTELVGGSR